jgi:hypothetical protein
MHKWKKLGLIFNPTLIDGPEWMKEFAQAPSILIFEKFVRVYFACRPKPDSQVQYVSYTAYVDLNRDNLFEILDIASKPIIPLGDLGAFDEFGTYPTSVIRDNGRILAYYAGWTRCVAVPFNIAIGIAESFDEGKTFNKIGNGPILSYTSDEPFNIAGPKIRKYNDTWYLWYLSLRKWFLYDGCPEQSHKIRMAWSSDGLNWERIGRDIIDNRIEEHECQASPDVFWHNNKYHMFFCYRHSINFRSKEGGYRIGYAYSTDLKNWIRDDSKAGIDVSAEGWDSEMVSYPNVFFLDGQVYMLYLGNQVGKYGFGLAKLEGELL